MQTELELHTLKHWLDDVCETSPSTLNWLLVQLGMQHVADQEQAFLETNDRRNQLETLLEQIDNPYPNIVGTCASNGRSDLSDDIKSRYEREVRRRCERRVYERYSRELENAISEHRFAMLTMFCSADLLTEVECAELVDSQRPPSAIAPEALKLIEGRPNFLNGMISILRNAGESNLANSIEEELKSETEKLLASYPIVYDIFIIFKAINTV